MRSRSVKRQKNQLELAFVPMEKGEAPNLGKKGTETQRTAHDCRGPAGTENLMEEICDPGNLKRALQRVCQNQGAPGIDGMTVQALPRYLGKHWSQIRTQLLEGSYKPRAARRVEIPKPGGGVRKLGIPTVLDRLVQQAILQVLQKQWDPTFSEHSYGFRPERDAHQAVAQAQEMIAQGHGWVVDIDLEQFFDRVNHDRLMARVAGRITDKRLLKLIRAFLNAGILEDGLVRPTPEGTPQGSPLSPLLSNLVLDELDRELEKRGLPFVRYADDCNIYVRSERAGQRVMESVSAFLTRKLRLKVNITKSAVARPSTRKFLGFSFSEGPEPKRIVAPQAIKRLRHRVAELTGRTRGISLQQMVKELSEYLTGWIGYFGFCERRTDLKNLDGWIRRRLRCAVWKQWQNGRQRYRELRRLGVKAEWAKVSAGSPSGPWRMSSNRAMNQALSNRYLQSLGLPTLETWSTA
ncbi:MAG TPA: group II intron reverse transcriptase/maturase [Thermoanaerobaculia bacterium]|nr:group II intron reverse transcriptase/maturase [Thermoanaerobaculia bacterium]